ncbi:MAG TPA: hypothetical protein VHG91_07175 [Longimicrobium sp.]|nr:hypothetical protein [Longimicrobium sp.]
MIRLLVLLGLVSASLLCAPRDAAAQCNGLCHEIVDDGGVIGHACLIGGEDKCWATTSRCITSPCGMAMHSDSDGRMLATSDGCGGKPAAILALKASQKPARDGRTPVQEPPRLALVEKPVPAKRGE